MISERFYRVRAKTRYVNYSTLFDSESGAREAAESLANTYGIPVEVFEVNTTERKLGTVKVSNTTWVPEGTQSNV